MVGVVGKLSPDMVVLQASSHPSLQPGVKLQRVANIFLRDSQHAKQVQLAYGLWLYCQTHQNVWSRLKQMNQRKHGCRSFNITRMYFNLCPPSPLQVDAAADAGADADSLGCGGLLRVDGRIISRFAFQLNQVDAQQ